MLKNMINNNYCYCYNNSMYLIPIQSFIPNQNQNKQIKQKNSTSQKYKLNNKIVNKLKLNRKIKSFKAAKHLTPIREERESLLLSEKLINTKKPRQNQTIKYYFATPVQPIVYYVPYPVK